MQTYLLPLATAFCAAVTVYLLFLRVRLPIGSRPAQALSAYLGEVGEVRQAGRAPRISRERVICAALGLPARPGTLVVVRLVAGLLPVLLLLLLGYPLVPALGAGALIALLVHGWLEGRWRRFRLGLERELPTFVSRLASTLLVTGAPLAALEEVFATLPGDSPLRSWLERLAAGLRTQGQAHMEQAREEAAALSPSPWPWSSLNWAASSRPEARALCRPSPLPPTNSRPSWKPVASPGPRPTPRGGQCI